LDGLVDRAAWQDTWGFDGCTTAFLGFDGAFAINRRAESIDNTAKKFRADRDINLDSFSFEQPCDLVQTHNFTSTLDCLAFLDQSIRTEEHDTDLPSF
jgi:hypothetical protein